MRIRLRSTSILKEDFSTIRASDISDDKKYLDAEEIRSVKNRATDLWNRATDWYKEAGAADDDFINRALDEDRKVSPDDVPNGEEHDRLRRELRPAISTALGILEGLQKGREGEDGFKKLSPEEAEAILGDTEEKLDRAESDLDDIGDVRQ